MMGFIKNLFSNKCEDLAKENEELKQKLIERQEVINQTNAYWKKKVYTLQAKNKKKKES
jgi:hypothetical protein